MYICGFAGSEIQKFCCDVHCTSFFQDMRHDNYLGLHVTEHQTIKDACNLF